MTELEKAAEAIYEKSGHARPWVRALPSLRQIALDQARAAIDALRDEGVREALKKAEGAGSLSPPTRKIPMSKLANKEAVEAAAEAVHQAYLDTCKRLGWAVKPENQLPYSELSEDSKELDRASVRATLEVFAPIFTAAIAEARDEGLEEAAREFDEYAKLARYYEQQAIDAGRTDEAAQHQTDAVDNEVAAIEIRALKGKP